jgi:hypothetical protein
MFESLSVIVLLSAELVGLLQRDWSSIRDKISIVKLVWDFE